MKAGRKLCRQDGQETQRKGSPKPQQPQNPASVWPVCPNQERALESIVIQHIPVSDQTSGSPAEGGHSGLSGCGRQEGRRGIASSADHRLETEGAPTPVFSSCLRYLYETLKTVSLRQCQEPVSNSPTPWEKAMSPTSAHLPHLQHHMAQPAPLRELSWARIPSRDSLLPIPLEQPL